MNAITWSNGKRKLRELTGWQHNPRQITEKQGERLLHSLDAFGQFQTIAIDPNNVVIDGHQRMAVWAAAEKYGLDYEVDVRICSRTLTDKERAKLVVLAHRGATGEWSWDALANLPDVDVADLVAWGFDEEELVGSGSFDEPETQDAEPQIDRAAELNKKWQVKPGDLWRIGEHRLLCGDSTKREDVQRVMGGEKAQLCFTDPPYGADIQYATHNDTQAALEGLIAGFFPIARDLCDVVALTPGINNVFLYPKPSWLLCWFYASGTGRSPWGFTAWQPVAVWGDDPKLKAGEGCHPDGFQWMMDKKDAETNQKLGHACPKPTSVWTRFLERLTSKTSKLVYDPFLGSGTTMVACENLGRKCRGIEISPDYCAVILERMQTAFPKLKIERTC